MKRIFAILALALALVSCGKDDVFEIRLTSDIVSTSCREGKINIPLEATFDYDVKIAGDAGSWISVASKSRSELVLFVYANSVEQSRSGKVYLCHGDITIRTITVRQNEYEPDEPEETELKYSAPENKKFIRMAYFPSYRADALDKMPDDYLQTVDVACYAFASINNDFTVSVQTPATLTKLVARCKKLGVKVVLSFAGTAATYKEMVKTRANRRKFIKSVMAVVEEYKLDGVDNDWEYPSAGDHTKHGNLLLMREFSNIIHAPGSEMTLSMAITPGIYAGNYQKGIDPGVYDCCDWFGVMVYDDSNPHSSYDMMGKAYNWWVGSAKMPSYKFIGGMPAYGRATGDNWSKSKSYATLVDTYGADPDADNATADGLAFNYNGRKTIAKKTQFLIDKKTGGYFFWEAGQDKTDDKSLLRTAADVAAAAL